MHSDVSRCAGSAVRYPVDRAADQIGSRAAAEQPPTRDHDADTARAARRSPSPTGCARKARRACSASTMPSLIGRPENPPAFPVEQVFEVGGQTLVVPDEPVQADPTKGRIAARRAGGDPAGRLSFGFGGAALRARLDARPVEVEVTAFAPGAAGTLRLESRRRLEGRAGKAAVPPDGRRRQREASRSPSPRRDSRHGEHHRSAPRSGRRLR